MGRRNRKKEILERLNSKVLDAKFLHEIQYGLNCPPFGAEAVLDVAKGTYLPFLGEQAVAKTLAGLFRGNSNIHLVSPDVGTPGDSVRVGSSYHGEVVLPRSPGAESGQVIPPTAMQASCLPMSPDTSSSQGEEINHPVYVKVRKVKQRLTCRKVNLLR